MNKAKIAWIQEQFAVEQIETEIQILLSKLKTLNGGNEISGISTGLALPIEVGAEESLWQEKLSNDPLLQELKAIETSSLQKVKLEKNETISFPSCHRAILPRLMHRLPGCYYAV